MEGTGEVGLEELLKMLGKLGAFIGLFLDGISLTFGGFSTDNFSGDCEFGDERVQLSCKSWSSLLDALQHLLCIDLSWVFRVVQQLGCIRTAKVNLPGLDANQTLGEKLKQFT
jgi:hypothetical protein